MAKKSTVWKNKIKGYELVDPTSLLANPHNFRLHNEIQAQHLETLLDTIGWVDVVKVNQNGKRIIDGHLRHSMAIQAGEELIPVLWVKLTKKQEKLALASLDWISSLAEIDTDILAGLVDDLDDYEILPDDSNLLEMIARDGGFDLEENPLDDSGPEIDKAEKLRKKWGVKTGQMWQLGEHRVICGDCTDEAVIEKLMGNEKARQLVTFPPYWDQRNYELGKFDWYKLANGFMKCAFEIVAGDPFDALVNLGLVHRGGVLRYWERWLDYCEKELGNKLYGWYIWDKGKSKPAEYHGRLALSHEFIFHFSVGRISSNKIVRTLESSKKRADRKDLQSKTFRQPDGTFNAATGSIETIGQLYKIPDSVIRASPAHTTGRIERDHPAVYSLDFVSVLIESWGGENEICYDPFLGSGTTLIACENLTRKCRGIEIEPKYVAIALERWHKMTGGDPELIDG